MNRRLTVLPPEKYEGQLLCVRCGDDGSGQCFAICADNLGFTHDESCRNYRYGDLCNPCEAEMLNEGDNIMPNIIKSGDRVRVTAHHSGGPTVEGTVKEAAYGYVTIQGCGLANFQETEYSIERLSGEEATPVVETTPVEKAKATLASLLNSYDESTRLAAARALIDSEPSW